MYEAAVHLRDAPNKGQILVPLGAGFVELWSGRDTFGVLKLLDQSKELKSLEIPTDVRFVLLTESSFVDYRGRYLEPLVEANRDKLKEIYRKGETIIYEVLDRPAQ